MRSWDLAGGCGKLELALKALQTDVAEIGVSWDDEANRQFLETYLVPLEPQVKEFIDAVNRLSVVLASAQRQCSHD